MFRDIYRLQDLSIEESIILLRWLLHRQTCWEFKRDFGGAHPVIFNKLAGKQVFTIQEVEVTP